MKKRTVAIVLCFAFVLLGGPTAALADIGPKPSVVIDFNGLENEKYYVTLLSEEPTIGPHSALGNHIDNQRYHQGDEDYEIWLKFVSYQDKDGYHFLQYFSDCSDTAQFTWGYYPPPKFKILLYFPEYDRFAVSAEVYERYAFDSYYRVDGKSLKKQQIIDDLQIIAVRNYDHTWELISLFARIIATIAIEVLIALFFGFRAKRQLFIIVVANIATQSILNILLNVVNYYQGSMMFVFYYLWLEALVLVLEAAIYSALLHKYNPREPMKKHFALLYALTANGVSFGIGLYIAHLLPGVF